VSVPWVELRETSVGHRVTRMRAQRGGASSRGSPRRRRRDPLSAMLQHPPYRDTETV
jgi:hypothetical protein